MKLLVGLALLGAAWGGVQVLIPSDGPPEPIGARLDLNRATLEELIALPGIGPVLAQRILDDRAEHGPYQTVEDLLRVVGIGPALLEALRPWVWVKVD